MTLLSSAEVEIEFELKIDTIIEPNRINIELNYDTFVFCRAAL